MSAAQLSARVPGDASGVLGWKPVLESGLIVEVPEAESLVSAMRSSIGFDGAVRVPAHVTTLYPFVDPHAITNELRERVAAAAAVVSPFVYELSAVECFDGVVWLRPTPDHAFRELTDRVVQEFPHHLPYGGAHPDPQPHVTVAMVDGDAGADVGSMCRTLGSEFDGQLPLACSAAALSLFTSDADGTWSRLFSVPLGS